MREKHIHIGDGTLLASLKSARDGKDVVCIDPSPMAKALLGRITSHLEQNSVDTLSVSLILIDIARDDKKGRGVFGGLLGKTPLIRDVYYSIYEAIDPPIWSIPIWKSWRKEKLDKAYRDAIGQLTARELRERITILDQNLESNMLEENSAKLVTFFYPSNNEKSVIKTAMDFASRVLVNGGILKMATELSEVKEVIERKLTGQGKLKLNRFDEKHLEPNDALSTYDLFGANPITNNNKESYYFEIKKQ